MRVSNPSTRDETSARLTSLFERELKAGRSVLAGFDFSFSFPAGSAAKLKRVEGGWRAWWSELAALTEDARDNRNNRFEAAANLNRRLTGAPGPFWGCPPGSENAWLTAKRPATTFAEHRLTEKRAREQHGARPQSSWKLYTAGAVGGQSLLGLPRLEGLRQRLGSRLRVWPFETGFSVPGETPVVWLAEIYPSLFDWDRQRGGVPDERQVRACAAEMRRAGQDGRLAQWLTLSGGLSAAERRTTTDEEGWILGVL